MAKKKEREQSFILINIARLLTESGRSKAGFLSDQAELKNSLFVGVCETWLCPGVADAEVCHDFPGYSISRADRVKRQGGGVALYLKESLSGDVIASFDNSVCQAIVVIIHQINTCFCYRPPDTRFSEFTEMVQCVDSVLSTLPTPTPNIVIMGDMTSPELLYAGRGVRRVTSSPWWPTTGRRRHTRANRTACKRSDWWNLQLNIAFNKWWRAQPMQQNA